MDENIVKIPGKVKRTCITWKEGKKESWRFRKSMNFFSDMELDSDQIGKKYSITWKQIMLMCSESVMMTMIYRMIL